MLEHSRIGLGEPDRWGDLCLVPNAKGMVVFAHCNGNSGEQRRNRTLARWLQQREFSTLLFDLLGPYEREDPEAPYDIERLAARVLAALDALPASVSGEPAGLFGSGTGTAAALVVAAHHRDRVSAVVSRAGRPELAGNVLHLVKAPTLLIVGAADVTAIEPNRRAYSQLRCERRIELVPRATHLFLEAGTLERVALRAGEWFAAHLRRPE
jgi:pimeloyl-ACP methyl ester carboxylesterase